MTRSFAKVSACVLFVCAFLIVKADAFEEKDIISGKLFRQPTAKELQIGVDASFSFAKTLTQFERMLNEKRILVVISNTSDSMMAQFKKANESTILPCSEALLQVEMAKSIKSQLDLTKEESISNLKTVEVPDSFKKMTCPVNPICKQNIYRTNDGSCNSQVIPNLGRSLTTYRRIALPDYSDGISAPRVSSDGSDLTSARLISTTVFDGSSVPQTNYTLAIMQFGQFINHDMEMTNQVAFGCGVSGMYGSSADVSCCNDGNAMEPALLHPACFPIAVPVDDKFYNGDGVITKMCMNFVRSVTGPRLDCSLGYADQLNSNTHWLDGSTIYGSDDATTNSVRSFKSGQLSMTYDAVNNRFLLPPLKSPVLMKFLAGDQRVNEHPQLTVMHTIWAREHNRIAKALASLNPTWNDETIFQESRRIVGAEIQHITYYEWLPSLLDKDTLYSNGLLRTDPNCYKCPYTGLSSGPGSNEFATAAMRFGHSTIQGKIPLFNESGIITKTYLLSNSFNDPSPLVNDPTFIDSALRGILFENMDTVDDLFTDEMWNKLFRGTAKFGFDIVALNIQRGRDHGLPSYNTYRQLCGLPKLKDFADFITNPKVPGLLSQVYASVDDIDLYVGLMSELSLPSQVLPPTLSCLIADHFSALKCTDKFYYENAVRNPFSAAQLASIRQTSLSRIICDNSDGSIKSVQPSAFKPVGSTSNTKLPCSKLPSVDLNLWKRN